MMSDELKVTVDLANVPAVVQALKEAQAAIDALRAENEALKAKWNSVPLDDLGNVLYLAVEYAKYHLSPSLDDDTDYIQAIRNVEAFQRNAMKEADNG